MKFVLKLSSLFLLIGSLSFMACEKEDVTIDENFLTGGKEENGKNGRKGGKRQGFGKCFEVSFPVTVSFPDGTTAEATDQETLYELFKTWKANNPNSEERPTFIFPIEVTLEDESVVSVANEEELHTLLEDCRPERNGFGKFRCLDVVFPITISFPDGMAAEAADEDAARDIFKTWKENNPDSEERPTLVFPIDITLEDGSVQTLENEEDLQEAAEDCRGSRDGHGRKGYHGKKCFQLVFPVTIDFPDGTSAEATDKESLRELFRTWKEEHTDREDRPTIAFPYDVELEDETVVTINNQEELETLKESCDD